ncbi:MAG: TOBE domain-containing protein [Gammaproteobacteria bacterium]|nr:TOBE domain-containing protein [Gammaproteobacteria bacterium]
MLDADATDGDLNVIHGTLSGRTFAGNLTRLFVDVGDEKQIVIEARSQDAPRQLGANINVGWQPADSRVLVE